MASPLSRRLSIEPLEDRRLLATLTVNSLDDNLTAGDGLVTLREAIVAANLNTATDLGQVGSGADTITFAPALTTGGNAFIDLKLGELTITASLTIEGPENDPLGISAFSNDPMEIAGDGVGGRVFRIDNGSSSRIDVTIANLGLLGGDVMDAGGAIAASENLTLINCVIVDSHAEGAGGGGIYLQFGSLTLANTKLIRNSTDGAGGGVLAENFGTISILESAVYFNEAESGGGGVHAIAGTLLEFVDSQLIRNRGADGGGFNAFDTNVSLIDSRVIENSAAGDGGGIRVANGNLQLVASAICDNESAGNGGGIYRSTGGIFEAVDSTISGNLAHVSGGGLYLSATALDSVIVSNSTIAGNRADLSGGGIHFSTVGSATIRVEHATISGNVSDGDDNGSGTGGGVRHDGSGTVILDHTIVAANDDLSDSDEDVAHEFEAHFSLIGYYTGAYLSEAPIGFPDGNGNLVGGPIYGGIDPLLGPLKYNGGPVTAMALLTGSPAIDAGNSTIDIEAAPTFDARRTGFARIFEGDGAGGAQIDIGAYEKQNIGGQQIFIVDTLVDELDEDYSTGDLSLREALWLANANHDVADIISFSLALSGTMVLHLGELKITDTVDIQFHDASALTIDASELSGSPLGHEGKRVFNIDDGNAAMLQNVEIAGLRLTGGDVRSVGYIAFPHVWAVDMGGAVLSREDLRLEESIVTGNTARHGGGIASLGGALIVSDCLIDDNEARLGGGIYGGNGSLTIANSVVTGNGADGGGGVFARAYGTEMQETWITDSVISENSANQGGGLYTGVSLPDAFTASQFAVIERSTITNNSASNGGGIFNTAGWHTGGTAILIIKETTISENVADQGGGVSNHRGFVRLEDCLVADNQAVDSSRSGGGLYNFGDMEVIRTTVRDNAASSGAGIANVGAIREYARALGTIDLFYADLLMIDSVVAGNWTLGLSGSGGGGILSAIGNTTVRRTSIHDNSSTNTSGGAGLRLWGGVHAIENSAIFNNVATLYSESEVAVIDTSNLGLFGWAFDTGIYNTVYYELGFQITEIESGDFDVSGNVARGGGILFEAVGPGEDLTPGELSIVGSTISGNTAGRGGGVFAQGNEVSVSNSTIALNVAEKYGGGLVALGNVPAVVDHTIIAGNRRGDLSADDVADGFFTDCKLAASYSLIGANIGATLTDNGGNLIGTLSAPIDAFLAPLADNGGPTKTHALLPRSPAIGAGDPDAEAGVHVPAFDQRGGLFSRVIGGRLDIGAVEHQPIPAAFFGDYNDDGFVDAIDYTVWRNTLGTEGMTRYDGADGSGNGSVGPEDYLVWKKRYGDFADDHGDDARSATPVEVQSVTVGTIQGPDDGDWLAFDAIGGTTYVLTISLTGLPDSVLRVFDTDGVTELAYNDDSDLGLASQIIWTAPADGLYFVEVRAYAAEQRGAYELSMVVQDDHGDAAFAATPIGVPSVVAGEIDPSLDRDFFSFEAVADTPYVISTILAALADSVLVLYDTDGFTELAYDDDGGPALASLINWVAPATGTYYVEVRGFGDNVGSYELAIDVEGMGGGGLGGFAFSQSAVEENGPVLSAMEFRDGAAEPSSTTEPRRLAAIEAPLLANAGVGDRRFAFGADRRQFSQVAARLTDREDALLSWLTAREAYDRRVGEEVVEAFDEDAGEQPSEWDASARDAAFETVAAEFA